MASTGLSSPGGLLSPGGKCDRYDIVRLIGAGGMGEVYQAMHEFTKKPVALKVLRVSKEHHVEKMRAEAMVLCRIKHQNLVEVYDAGIADLSTTRGTQALIWMAMELLEGESLRERLVREGAVRPALALEWAAQTAEGVDAAHAAGVIHRDLKPENVFITKRGDVRVLDFGTAKFEGFGHNVTRAGDRVGTIPYMSPEHIAGLELDGRSDIYALGFILYEMLAGRHPFSDQRGGFPPLETLLPMVIAGDPEPLAHHVGAQAWEVVRRCLEKERDARYRTMREVAQAARVASAAYGTDASGVALRLSGGVPALTASNASGHQLAQTPPPLATHVAAHPPAVGPRPSGVSAGVIATMALVAALAGAGVVVMALPRGAEPGAAPAAEESARSRPTAGDSSGPAAPSAQPRAPDTATPSAAPPSAPTASPPTTPTATPPTTPPPTTPPRPPTRPTPRPPTQPPTRPPCVRTDEIIPRPCP
jgi:serine/threonine-protein kinase